MADGNCKSFISCNVWFCYISLSLLYQSAGHNLSVCGSMLQRRVRGCQHTVFDVVKEDSLQRCITLNIRPHYFTPFIQLEKWTHTQNSPKTHLEQMECHEKRSRNKKIRRLYYMMARCNPLKTGNNSYREMR